MFKEIYWYLNSSTDARRVPNLKYMSKYSYNFCLSKYFFHSQATLNLTNIYSDQYILIETNGR